MPATEQETVSSGSLAEPEEAVLEVRNAVKSFQLGERRIEALCEVSLRAHAGRITGLIGPDAAGKTTLMRLAAGLLLPDAGSITVLGLDTVRHATRVQSTVGYMPQHFGLYEDLSVRENLDLYADLQGVPHEERSDRYAELTRMTGLGPFTRRLARRLSGGMKQKLGLACTLVHPPRLLLLDEPTVGVDPVSRRELWTIVLRLVRDEGVSVVLSTAYLDEAERCDEVVLLHEGRVLGEGPPQAFTRRIAGRTFAVGAPGRGRRDVQRRLSDRADVLDAVIQGDHVRVVTREPKELRAEDLAPDLRDVSIHPVEPRFEDSFIDILSRRKEIQDDGAARPSHMKRPAPLGVQTDAAVSRPTVIAVENLQRRFGDFYAVRDVTFDVRRGEVFGLLGANGAGKSTTFRMLCGLLPASGGSLRVAGLDLRHAAASARQRIGYMSQKFSLYGNLTVLQNLEFFSGAYGLRGGQRTERIRWAQDRFELDSVASATSGNLPLGFKQRLAMACALMHEPEILFLDEPTSGVDPVARREFWHRIGALADRGVTVMVTTHFMEEAEYCDRLAVMAEGRLLAIGTPSEIKDLARNAAHPEPTMEDAFIRLLEINGQEKTTP
ncbi:ABC transporter ATP-binding protein [Candidatus Sumerlaeota bacterium]|nr:ABC transporter ATP-binding protein [Candidatus Sumerlaeota bacterium]